MYKLKLQDLSANKRSSVYERYLTKFQDPQWRKMKLLWCSCIYESHMYIHKTPHYVYVQVSIGRKSKSYPQTWCVKNKCVKDTSHKSSQEKAICRLLLFYLDTSDYTKYLQYEKSYAQFVHVQILCNRELQQNKI